MLLIDWGPWHLLYNPRSFLGSCSLVLNSAGVFRGPGYYLGSGFRIGESNSRWVPHGVVFGSFFMGMVTAMINVALNGNLVPTYASKLTASALASKQTGEMSLDPSEITLATNEMQRMIQRQSINSVSTITIPIALTNLFGATEWAMVYFAAATLKRAMRCVLLVKTFQCSLEDMGIFGGGLSPTRDFWRLHFGWRGLVPLAMILIALGGFLDVGPWDGGQQIPRLSAAIAHYVVPMLIFIVFFSVSYTFRWRTYMGLRDPIVMAQWVIGALMAAGCVLASFSRPKLFSYTPMPPLMLDAWWLWIPALTCIVAALIVVPLTVGVVFGDTLRGKVIN
eukprot:Gregarina_sp_Poly_1__3311@NODE_1952_length_3009_cov_10_353161_g1257_i0_p2_GENE_NODE_1952_length_3009_cov_10_353161_g1257_i0NODE_1952_length_3009_cov_10_353161_g1257_i0_p2_ORF_typecomplete_len336_score25_22_NODE_1952_length_3009_cov_10_353161_g1257_i04811488